MMPDLMRQWWVVPEGGIAVLKRRQVPVPQVREGQVLVRVEAAGINRGELITMAKLNAQRQPFKPYPSGIEFAGVVVAAGSATRIAQGSRVMGRGRACHADFTVVAEEDCLPVPDNMTLDTAAAIPNVFVTAHDAMVTHAEIENGESVLVSAASSGVGTAALQIARLLGATRIVATTRNMAKVSALLALGATEVVDASAPGWEVEFAEAGEGINVAIDQVGGDLFESILRVLSVGGRYVSVGRNAGPRSEIDLDWLALRQLTLYGVTFRTRSKAQALACSRAFADDLLEAFSGPEPTLVPVVDRLFAFDELRQAHAYQLGNDQVGKVLLRAVE